MKNIVENAIKENGGVEIILPHDTIYHMDWDTLQSKQPGKIDVLNSWWEVSKRSPSKHSTPVYDVDDRIVYASYGLLYHSGTNDYIKTRAAVIKSIDTGRALKMYAARKNGDIPIFNGHHFLAVEDVPVKILKAALEDYKKAKNSSKIPSSIDLVIEQMEAKNNQMKLALDAAIQALKDIRKSI